MTDTTSQSGGDEIRALLQNELCDRTALLLKMMSSAGLRLQVPDTDIQIIAGPQSWIQSQACEFSSTAGSAKGGVTSLEELDLYGWDADGMGIDNAFGNYYRKRDIERLLATQAQAAAPALTREAFEEIAASWDGCEYEDAMIPDIGAALRRDFERLAHPAAAVEPVAIPAGWREALVEARQYIEATSMVGGYGFHRPANPHDFHPDAEGCSEEEIAAHKAACEAYDKGEYTPERGSEWVSPMHILRAPWGIGSYNYRDPGAAKLLADIDNALAAAPSPAADLPSQAEPVVAGQRVAAERRFGKLDVMEVWACVRKNNHSIPDDALDDMREVLLSSIAAPSSLPLAVDARDQAPELFTCKGKGGEYEVIGYANGAGTMRGQTVVVYQPEGDDGAYYFRTRADFEARMEPIGQRPASQEGGEAQ